jgi:hypothetical protein
MYSDAYLLHGLLHILLNCSQIDIGTDLNQFKQLTSNYTSKVSKNLNTLNPFIDPINTAQGSRSIKKQAV